MLHFLKQDMQCECKGNDSEKFLPLYFLQILGDLSQERTHTVRKTQNDFLVNDTN